MERNVDRDAIIIIWDVVRAERHEELLLHYLPLCTVEFRKRVARYRNWQQVHAAVLGRALVHKATTLLNQPLPLDSITLTRHGKPYFKGHQLSFSISHAGDVVVCAVSLFHRVGIDIEQIVNIDLDAIKTTVDDQALDHITGEREAGPAFFHYWTRKEAVLKAVGCGLSIPLSAVILQEKQATVAGTCWHLTELNIFPCYVSYIALPLPGLQIYTYVAT
jgi:4'-phosphopantetheinyl transferase